MASGDDPITIENVNHPGQTRQVNRARYEAMKQAMLKALPKAAPGLNQEEIREAVLAFLPEDLFPGGQKAGWWAKTVQLDLEAKGVLGREPGKPLRWRRMS